MLFLDFNPFPLLTTERLIINVLSVEKDTDSIFALRGNALAMKYIGKPPLQSRAQAAELIAAYLHNLQEKAGITWGIFSKESAELIGTVGYHKLDLPNHRAEIGYMLHPDQWRKGYISEVLKAVLDYGFGPLRLHSVEAKINPNNHASRNTLLKFGFVKEGYFRENYYDNGVFCDTEVFSLLHSAHTKTD